MKIVVPLTEADLDRYYALRYEVLRKPWNQPFSSVKDELEETSMHAMLVDDEENVAGVCRMQFNDPEEAQLRFMGIRPDMQGKGLGKLLLDYFDKIAREHGMKRLVLQARENAVEFYKRNGFEVLEKTYLMWDIIQHYKMIRRLEE
jgi:N-acetylglutamate synthase-like GNAT family acetyltransferase